MKVLPASEAPWRHALCVEGTTLGFLWVSLGLKRAPRKHNQTNKDTNDKKNKQANKETNNHTYKRTHKPFVLPPPPHDVFSDPVINLKCNLMDKSRDTHQWVVYQVLQSGFIHPTGAWILQASVWRRSFGNVNHQRAAFEPQYIYIYIYIPFLTCAICLTPHQVGQKGNQKSTHEGVRIRISAHFSE